MTKLVVAETILDQLGGGRFRMMTGAKDFLGDEKSLRFRIPRSNGITHVHIELTPNDDYTVTFNRAHGLKVTQVDRLEGIYCDQLQEVFTRATGLYTSF
jgi:hypothetical protein